MSSPLRWIAGIGAERYFQVKPRPGPAGQMAVLALGGTGQHSRPLPMILLLRPESTEVTRSSLAPRSLPEPSEWTDGDARRVVTFRLGRRRGSFGAICLWRGYACRGANEG